jgi:hypothetical protein
MKIALARFVCGRCKTEFEAPLLGEMSYGEFLLWSSRGSVAYLNALADPIFAEVRRLLDSRFQAANIDSLVMADMLQGMFGPMACDPDDHGAPFMMNVKPPCPNCGADKPSSWDFVDPPKFLESEISHVSHNAWNALSADEKLLRFDQFVRACSLEAVVD